MNFESFLNKIYDGMRRDSGESLKIIGVDGASFQERGAAAIPLTLRSVFKPLGNSKI